MKGKGVGSSKPKSNSTPRPMQPRSFLERLDDSLGLQQENIILNATTDELTLVLPVLRERVKKATQERNIMYSRYNDLLINSIENELRKRRNASSGSVPPPITIRRPPSSSGSVPAPMPRQRPPEEYKESIEEEYKDDPENEEFKEGEGMGKRNAWISHCKKYQQKHRCTWKEAMMGAKATYKKGGNLKFQKGLTKEEMEAYKKSGQYTSGGIWVQKPNGLYSWMTKKGGFIVGPNGRMYADNDPKAQKWKK